MTFKFLKSPISIPPVKSSLRALSEEEDNGSYIGDDPECSDRHHHHSFNHKCKVLKTKTPSKYLISSFDPELKVKFGEGWGARVWLNWYDHRSAPFKDHHNDDSDWSQGEPCQTHRLIRSWKLKSFSGSPPLTGLPDNHYNHPDLLSLTMKINILVACSPQKIH